MRLFEGIYANQKQSMGQSISEYSPQFQLTSVQPCHSIAIVTRRYALFVPFCGTGPSRTLHPAETAPGLEAIFRCDRRAGVLDRAGAAVRAGKRESHLNRPGRLTGKTADAARPEPSTQEWRRTNCDEESSVTQHEFAQYSY
jgi:hypothetical protein